MSEGQMQQMVKFELPAMWFHALMTELEFCMMVAGSAGTGHSQQNAKELYYGLAKQAGNGVTTEDSQP